MQNLIFSFFSSVTALILCAHSIAAPAKLSDLPADVVDLFFDYLSQNDKLSASQVNEEFREVATSYYEREYSSGRNLDWMRAIRSTPQSQEHYHHINSISFDPSDGSRFVSSSTSGTIKMWETASAKLIWQILDSGITGISQYIAHVAWSPNGKLLSVSYAYHFIQIRNSVDGSSVHYLNSHNMAVKQTAWSPDGTILASCADDGLIILWDPKTGRKLKEFQRNLGGIISIAWSPDGTQLAALDHFSFYLLDIENGEVLRTFQFSSSRRVDIAWSHANNVLASSNLNGQIEFWDGNTGERLKAFHDPNVPMKLQWSPNGKMIAAHAYTGSVSIWHYEDEKLLAHIDPKVTRIPSVAWSTDGKMIATPSELEGGLFPPHLGVKLWSVQNPILMDKEEFKTIPVMTVHITQSIPPAKKQGFAAKIRKFFRNRFRK